MIKKNEQISTLLETVFECFCDKKKSEKITLSFFV